MCEIASKDSRYPRSCNNPIHNLQCDPGVCSTFCIPFVLGLLILLFFLEKFIHPLWSFSKCYLLPIVCSLAGKGKGDPPLSIETFSNDVGAGSQVLFRNNNSLSWTDMKYLTCWSMTHFNAVLNVVTIFVFFWFWFLSGEEESVGFGGSLSFFLFKSMSRGPEVSTNTFFPCFFLANNPLFCSQFTEREKQYQRENFNSKQNHFKVDINLGSFYTMIFNSFKDRTDVQNETLYLTVFSFQQARRC